MDRKWLYWLVQLMTLFTLTKQATDIAPDPVLTLLVLNVEVQEKEDRSTILNSGNAVLSCIDDDPARAYIQSVAPATPCGIACFQLQPCTVTTDPEFCLHFLPSEGSLSFSQASSYTVTIICTDDIEPTSQSFLTVTVVPNSPPQFDPAVLIESVSTNGITKIATSLITTVSATDVDNDPVSFTMTLSPPNDYIAIGRVSGRITFQQDPRLICEATISASILATDGFHADIGPKVIDIAINGNLKPTFTNLDTTVQVAENTAAGSTVFTLGHSDAYKIGTVVEMRSSSNAALELYELNGFNLRLREIPDYERSETRSIQLFFQANDGFCFSDVYSLTIEIVDVNEAPEYQPPAARVVIFAYEGLINTNTGQEAYDDDQGETLTHTLVTDTSGMFRVDPTSGQIFTPNEVDIDNNRIFRNFALTLRVTDSGGLFDEQNVVLQVRDSNDQAPYFQTNTYTFAANLCSKLGDVLGTVAGQDDDSTYQNNNVFYFGGGGGFTSVASDGQVVLTTPVTAGTSSTGTATITDTGLYPGPLSGTPVTYTVTCCAPCPTTAAPGGGGGGGATTTAGGGGGGGVTTTAAPVTAAADLSNSSSGFSDALPWVIPAAILGLIWLALMGYLIYRFCCPCKSPCPSRTKPIEPKPKPKPQPKINKPPKPLPPKPAFKIDPLPPATPVPEPTPYLFGFWKEKYTDQNHVRQPQRQNKPVAIEHLPNEGNPPTPPPELRLGPNNASGPNFIPTNLNAPKGGGAHPPTPPTPAWTDPTKKKSKFCVIL